MDFLRTILNSVNSLLEKINSTSLAEKRNPKIVFDPVNDVEYTPRIIGDIQEKFDEFSDLTFEEFMDLKELVNILGLNGENSMDNLATFLSLKNNVTGN